MRRVPGRGPPSHGQGSLPPVVWYNNAVKMLEGASTMHTNNKDDRMSLTPLPLWYVRDE